MRPEKKSIIDEITTKVDESVFLILADYKGLSVEKTNSLRAKLAEADAGMQVVKNRILSHVVNGKGLAGLEPALDGPSAMVYGSGDVAQVAKTLKAFIKENELPVIKMGAMEGVVLSAADVEALASLPSREQLLAQVVGTIAAPMSQLVGVANQKLASLLYVLQAAADKKQASGA